MSFFSNLMATARTYDSSLLLVDGMNTFIRGMAVSQYVNDNGDPIGGYSAFLLSLGSAIKTIKPTRCIIMFDGVNSSIRRTEIFPEYKASRNLRTIPRNRILYESVEQERIASRIQMERLIQYLKLLPVHILFIDNAEADDVIAHTCQRYPASKKCIMSTDVDFYQLIDNKTTVWSPKKKIIITEKYIKENFDMLVKNFIVYRCMDGDNADDIPGVKGVGLKTLQKHIPLLFQDEKVGINDIYDYVNSHPELEKYKAVQSIKAQREIVERNYKLMQLEKPLLSQEQINEINSVLDSPVPKLNTYSFIKHAAVDGLEGAITYIQPWLDNVFSHLTNYIKL